MAYIYQIVNNVNNKIYVGKTIHSDLQQRWNEHLRSIDQERCSKRPLYAAIRKYGKENFRIEPLEEVTDLTTLNDREVYWIEQKQSFKHGYNATIGGDGKSYLDYELILATYKQFQNVRKTAEFLGHDERHLADVLKSLGTELRTPQSINKEMQSKVIGQYSLTGDLISIYPSLGEAAKAISKPKTHISACANGKRKTAYGFVWKYL